MANKVRCRWQEDKRLLVNPDGQAMPCCYLANLYYQSALFTKNERQDELFEGHKAQFNHPVMTEYFKREKELNVFYTTMEDILDNEWFTKILPESWESEETIHIQCKRMCSRESEID
jgi:hypothetical protein